jgi:hypothetical protein
MDMSGSLDFGPFTLPVGIRTVRLRSPRRVTKNLENLIRNPEMVDRLESLLNQTPIQIAILQAGGLMF